MFMGRFVLVLVFLTACSTTAAPRAATVTPSPTTATPQHSPAPSRSAFLAVVGGPKNSSVSLVASDGTVVATASVQIPAYWVHTMMSWTSASRTRLYYLNAGSEVRYLAPDGTNGTVGRIALGVGEQAGFAVSPDDKRIAVSVFSYTWIPQVAYKGMRLYVEDVDGGGNHVDIFSSTTVAEFPIGWTTGRLILALTEPRCCRAITGNPYDASAYHVVDPDTGSRLASLCDNSAGPEGPIEPIGTICYHPNAAPTYQRWDGSPFDAPAAVPNPSAFLNALSPDGTRVAVGQVGGQIWIWGPRGSADWLNEAGYVFGWLDQEYIVISSNATALSTIDVVASATAGRLWTVRATAEISPFGVYLGTFPAAVT
jgi:hypothetical protein